MRSSKKAILASAAFLLVTVLLSLLIIEPYLHSRALAFEDANLRDEHAGEFDMLICGASHAQHAFIPSVIDEVLGCTSYNLSGSLLTMNGRKALLEIELERNPVETVVLEISYNALRRDESAEYAEGDMYLMPRLPSFGDRMKYFFRNISFGDYQNAYSYSLFLGMTYWGRALAAKNINVNNVIESDLGFVPANAKDIAIPENEWASRRDEGELITGYRAENIDALRELVELCEQHGAKVIVAVVPVSDGFIWKLSGWEEFSSLMVRLSEELHFTLFDFNLLKNRRELFSDHESFSDEIHLSTSGADVFSTVFAQTLKLYENGESLDSLFYTSYEQLKNSMV